MNISKPLKEFGFYSVTSCDSRIVAMISTNFHSGGPYTLLSKVIFLCYLASVVTHFDRHFQSPVWGRSLKLKDNFLFRTYLSLRTSEFFTSQADFLKGVLSSQHLLYTKRHQETLIMENNQLVVFLYHIMKDAVYVVRPVIQI